MGKNEKREALERMERERKMAAMVNALCRKIADETERFKAELGREVIEIVRREM